MVEKAAFLLFISQPYAYAIGNVFCRVPASIPIPIASAILKARLCAPLACADSGPERFCRRTESGEFCFDMAIAAF
ncbi:MAG: hypothetical protein LBU72_02195 [Burkholderiaceae bacterium]|jgi:hypothetical protein|nr:hypothetical protein [Burkholderiaceae bacterium]